MIETFKIVSTVDVFFKCSKVLRSVLVIQAYKTMSAVKFDLNLIPKSIICDDNTYYNIISTQKSHNT